MASLTYKIAETENEFEQIFRLNYKTFVEEIPQHERNAEKRLVGCWQYAINVPFHWI
jgi:hypothetical protein